MFFVRVSGYEVHETYTLGMVVVVVFIPGTTVSILVLNTRVYYSMEPLVIKQVIPAHPASQPMMHASCSDKTTGGDVHKARFVIPKK